MPRLQSNQPLTELPSAVQARLRSVALLYLVTGRDWPLVGELAKVKPETARGWFNGAYPVAGPEALAEAAERYEAIRERQAEDLVALSQHTLAEQMKTAAEGRTRVEAARHAWNCDRLERELVEKFKTVIPLEAVNELLRRHTTLALTYIDPEKRDEYVRHAQSIAAPGA